VTDRIRFLTVALENDLRDDDEGLRRTMDAIACMRGVLRVERGVADPAAWTLESRIRMSLSGKIYDFARAVMDVKE